MIMANEADGKILVSTKFEVCAFRLIRSSAVVGRTGSKCTSEAIDQLLMASQRPSIDFSQRYSDRLLYANKALHI